jgi:superfamily II DNA or RNA helicase
MNIQFHQNKPYISKNRNELDILKTNVNTSFQSYLGKKGYTLLKSELSIELQKQLKEALMVRPYVPGSPVQVDKTFPAYRESGGKIYIPRFYGFKMFGPAKENKLSEGDDIGLTFQGALRDYQVPIMEAYVAAARSVGGGLLELYCGAGKTDLTIYIIGQLKKKTIIIVHKEFLMNQWIERIEKYYPEAKIGKIQGQTIDIEGKDIVMCMLQSLSMKDYPATMFDSFGFTIIDEVHHISSEVFSNALFKLVTKYMLGLSATMNRKDGTTKVFKMFLGDVVYKLERSKDETVIVRGITYKTSDDEYNQVETDFRGNVALARMIGKICDYNGRSEFILRVLKDMLAENPRQQIMMIAQYKSILKYMYDAIKHRDIATVGYYVGGMKESALKESETKQVVLATYTMAAEGLDIKTLSTLFMITPMTNIEQAVGRILRSKHDFSPVVVDIVDTHDNFKKQWAKRRAFYKKQNYEVVTTDSIKYKYIHNNNSVENENTVFTTDIFSKKKSSIVEKKTVYKLKEEEELEEEELEEEELKEEEELEEEELDKKMVGKCFLKMKK